MDIWAWTWDVDEDLRKDGHIKLADYMDRLPSDTVDGNYNRVDKYIEEAIQMARDISHPWVEIFLRHWRLQGTILHRQEPKDMIKEAVSLLEFSHRPGNIDCPQSICVVQDLSNCYAAFDGPGFAEERINVCEETLSRINASWPCFTCISGEYASVLIDLERFDDCIEFLNECDNKLVEAGEERDTAELLQFRLKALAKLGEIDKARKLSKLAKNEYGGENFKSSLKVDMAYIEMCAKKYSIAYKKLPSFEKIKMHSSQHIDWAEVVYQAALNDEKFRNEEYIKNLEFISKDMERRGTYRHALILNSWLVELYRLKKNKLKANSALEAMKRVQPNLNRDLGAKELIKSLDVDLL